MVRSSLTRWSTSPSVTLGVLGGLVIAVALVLAPAPAAAQSSAIRQLPHATCLAMAAAGIARGQAERWVGPPPGRKRLRPQGGLSEGAAILDSIFDGRAPSATSRAPCVPSTLTPAEVQRLRAVIPKLAADVRRAGRKWKKRLDKANRTIADAAARGRRIAEARRKVKILEDKARAEVARAPRYANNRAVLAKLGRIETEAKYWNQRAIKHAQGINEAKETKKEAMGVMAQLGRVRSELGEMGKVLAK